MAGGKSQVLVSGIGMTNSFVYTAKFTTRGYAKTSVLIDAVHIGSGISYTIRGYLKEGLDVPYSIGSGAITISGSQTLITSGLDLAYDQIEIGLQATQTARSGAATVIVTGKRR